MLRAMNRDELVKISFELEQSLYSHQRWYKSLNRVLVCRLTYNKRDTVPTAHKECRFGQWYYHNNMAMLHNLPEFIALGDAHQKMHQLATAILLKLDTNQPILPSVYDQFINASDQLDLEIKGLKNEIDAILSNHDPLTMTINRASVLPALRKQQELNKRHIQTSCIAIIHTDFLNKVNNEHGHFVGDKVLIDVGHYLMENLRPYDRVFRYSDDDFLVCIPDSNILKANELIDRIRAGISAKFFDIGTPTPLKITVSCGVVTLDTDAPIEQSIDKANKAMLLAKSNGRNQTVS